ncbi:MAG TPA: N-(5'-phosphoribosyl)anthranilate isomerase, partial [Polyangia bacterium]
MSFVIKICGLTSAEDVEAAVASGATAIGINLWPGSKRFAGAQAARVAAAVPANVWRVGVFVNATADEVARQARALDLTHVQLHGDEAPRDFAGLGWPIVRAVRVKDIASLAELARWPDATLLLDAFAEGYGGAGAVAPW